MLFTRVVHRKKDRQERNKDEAHLSEGGVDLGRALLVPEADRVDEPEEVLPLRPGDGLLPQQLEDGGPHGGPFVLETQLSFVLQHFAGSIDTGQGS